MRLVSAPLIAISDGAVRMVPFVAHHGRLMRIAAILLFLISTSAACSAAPVSLTFQSTGSGSFNNAAFSNTAYTIYRPQTRQIVS